MGYTTSELPLDYSVGETKEEKQAHEQKYLAEEEAKLTQAYFDFARQKLQDPNFNLESTDALKTEIKQNTTLKNAILALNKKKKIAELNTEFKTLSHDQAFYGCDLVKGEEDEQGKLITTLNITTRDQYILTGKKIWFKKAEETEAKQLRQRNRQIVANLRNELKDPRQAKKEELDIIRGSLVNPSTDLQTDSTAISPSMLSCSNAKQGFETVQYIDPNNLIRLQDVLNKLLLNQNLLKIKLSVHFVTVNGKKQPVIEYHANSGKDKASVRLAERRVIDMLTSYFLKYYENVQVLAQLHEPAYEENEDKTGLKVVNEELVWSENLPNIMDEFEHKITNFTAPKRVIYKPRGQYDQDDNYLGDDGFANPQIEKNKVWDSNMYAWTASRPSDNDEKNSEILKRTPTPSKDSVVDFRKEGSHCPPHEPVILETPDMTWIAFGDLSRKDKKAFKNIEKLYQKETALEEIKENGNLSYKLKPEVLEAQRLATKELYIHAANRFLALLDGNGLEAKRIDNFFIQNDSKLNKEQKNALVNLKEVINKYQGNNKNDTPTPLDKNNFYQMFMDTTRSINADSVVEFTSALNNVIKTQVLVDNPANNKLAKAWEDALDEWNNTSLTELKKYIIPSPPGEKEDYLNNKKYHTEMSASDLRALSAHPTQGGGCNPFQSLLGAFGLETTGGWSAVHGLTNPTNEQIAKSLLYEKTETIAQTLLLSPANEVYFTGFDAADDERSIPEKRSNSTPPSIALKKMLETWFGLMRRCNEACIELGEMHEKTEELPKSPEAPSLPATEKQVANAPKGPKLHLEEHPPIFLPDELDIKSLSLTSQPQNIFWQGKMWYREANSTEVTEQPDFKDRAVEYDADLTRKTRHAYEQAVKCGSIQAKCSIVQLPDDQNLDDLETSIDNQYILHQKTICFRAANSKDYSECPISKEAKKLQDLTNAKFDIVILENQEKLEEWKTEREKILSILKLTDDATRAKELKKHPAFPSRAYIQLPDKLYFSDIHKNVFEEVRPDEVPQKEWEYFISLYNPQKNRGKLKHYTNVNSEEANLIKWCTGHTILKPVDKEADVLDKFFPPLLKDLGELRFAARTSRPVQIIGGSTQNSNPSEEPNGAGAFFRDIFKRLGEFKAAFLYTPPFELKGKRKHDVENLLKAVLKFQQIYTVFKMQNQSESGVKPSELQWDKLKMDMDWAADTIRACCGGLKERNTQQLAKIATLVLLACSFLALSFVVLFLTDNTFSTITNELLNIGIPITQEAVKITTQVAGFVSMLGSTALGAYSFYTNKSITHNFAERTEENFRNYESYCRSYMAKMGGD